MDLNIVIFDAAMFVVGISIIAWLVWDTQRNLKAKYTDGDVDKFLKDNSVLMDQLAGKDSSVWILTVEVWTEANAGGWWARVRYGVYLDKQKAYDEFQKIMEKCAHQPLYFRGPSCERERLIV